MHTCWMSYEALLFHCSTCRVESLYKFENVNGQGPKAIPVPFIQLPMVTLTLTLTFSKNVTFPFLKTITICILYIYQHESQHHGSIVLIPGIISTRYQEVCIHTVQHVPGTYILLPAGTGHRSYDRTVALETRQIAQRYDYLTAD